MHATRHGVRGILDGMDDPEQQFMALVERIRGYPMPETARAVILAEIEATYRRERATRPPRLAQLDLDPVVFQSR